jgi:hypothetical protein
MESLSSLLLMPNITLLLSFLFVFLITYVYQVLQWLIDHYPTVLVRSLVLLSIYHISTLHGYSQIINEMQ